MSFKIAAIVAKSGILPTETLRQFQRWGLLPDISEVPPPASAEEFVRRIQQALEENDLMVVKETDLDIVHRFVHTQKVGSLYVAYEPDQPTKAFEVAFGRTLTGEYIFPWQGDDISGVLTNGITHMTYKVEDTSKSGRPITLLKSVFFEEVREVFFGDMKVFIVCRGKEE